MQMAKTASIIDLIKIQKAKGYAKQWIYHYLKTANDYKEYGRLMKYHYKWAERIIQMKNL
jgi:hypothetical protein